MENIGAIWLKTSSSGKQYMSGEITINGQKTRFVCYTNDYKKSSAHPDWRLFPSKDQVVNQPSNQSTLSPEQKKEITDIKQQAVGRNTGSNDLTSEGKPVPFSEDKKDEVWPDDEINPDDIPF